jgi:hypothetical protein
MKRFLRLDATFTQDDEEIAEMISDAREWCENYTYRAFVLQVQRTTLDFFPGYVDEKVARGANVSGALIGGPTAALAGIRYAVYLPYPRTRAIVLFQYLGQPGEWIPLVEGIDYRCDLQSQPARLTPPFGQVWPVAQVQLGAVSIDHLCGYGGEIVVSCGAGSAVIDSPYQFLPAMAGIDGSQPLNIRIPGAGAEGADLFTSIASVSSGGVATLAALVSTGVDGVPAWLGDPVPHGIKQAIKQFVTERYERRIDGNEPSDAVKSSLRRYRDLRL